MSKDVYLNSQRGKSYTAIVREQPMVDAVGSIRGDNLRNVVAILAAGLQFRLDNAPSSPLRTALLTAFKYLTLTDYAINLSLQENVQLLQNAVTAGLVTADEYAQFIALATYQKPELHVTRDDCIRFYGGNIWNVLDATDTRKLRFRLNTLPPEPTVIIFEAQDCRADGSKSDWYYATALHVDVSRDYCFDIPHNGYARSIRWRCEYPLNAIIGV